MKYRNRLKRLDARRAAYDKMLREDRKIDPLAFCRPGSQRR